MPKPSIFGVPTTVLSNVGGVLIDAVLSRATRRQNLITENPIESGSTVSDHIARLPLVLEMEGRLTDTPFAFNRVVVAGSPPRRGEFGRALIPAPGSAESAFDTLVELSESKEFFDVVSGNKLFKRMQFSELDDIGSPGDGYSKRFTATLIQLQVVDSDGAINRGNVVDPNIRNGAAATLALGFQAVLTAGNIVAGAAFSE